MNASNLLSIANASFGLLFLRLNFDPMLLESNNRFKVGNLNTVRLHDLRCYL